MDKYNFGRIAKLYRSKLSDESFIQLNLEIRKFSLLISELVKRNITNTNKDYISVISLYLDDIIYQVLARILFIDLSNVFDQFESEVNSKVKVGNFSISDIFLASRNLSTYDVNDIKFSYLGVETNLYDLCLSIPIYEINDKEVPNTNLKFTAQMMDINFSRKWYKEQLPRINNILNKVINSCINYVNKAFDRWVAEKSNDTFQKYIIEYIP